MILCKYIGRGVRRMVQNVPTKRVQKHLVALWPYADGRCRATNTLLSSTFPSVCFESHPVYHPPSPQVEVFGFSSFRLPVKDHAGGKKCLTDEEVKQEVLKCTKEMARQFYEEGVKKFVPRLTTCIERQGDRLRGKINTYNIQ